MSEKAKAEREIVALFDSYQCAKAREEARRKRLMESYEESGLLLHSLTKAARGFEARGKIAIGGHLLWLDEDGELTIEPLVRILHPVRDWSPAPQVPPDLDDADAIIDGGTVIESRDELTLAKDALSARLAGSAVAR